MCIQWSISKYLSEPERIGRSFNFDEMDPTTYSLQRRANGVYFTDLGARSRLGYISLGNYERYLRWISFEIDRYSISD